MHLLTEQRETLTHAAIDLLVCLNKDAMVVVHLDCHVFERAQETVAVGAVHGGFMLIDLVHQVSH